MVAGKVHTQYDTNILGLKHKNHWNILYESWKSSYFSNFLCPFHQKPIHQPLFQHKRFMMRLSIITPIDHLLKGTNLHKILVLYHLQLRRAIRPRCRTNILMRGNHHTSNKYLDISMSSSSHLLPPPTCQR